MAGSGSHLLAFREAHRRNQLPALPRGVIFWAAHRQAERQTIRSLVLAAMPQHLCNTPAPPNRGRTSRCGASSTLAPLTGPRFEQGNRSPAFNSYIAESLAQRRIEVFQSIVDVREDALAVVKIHHGLGDPRAPQFALHDG